MKLSRNGNYVWLTSDDDKHQSPAIHISDAEFFFNMGAEAQREFGNYRHDNGTMVTEGFIHVDFNAALRKKVKP